MKIRMKLGAALLCFTAFVSVLSASLIGAGSTDAEAAAAAQEGEAVSVAALDNTGADDLRFFVTLYNGDVCVYHYENRNVPAIVTDIEVSDLRESDRELLEDGIEVVGREELLMLLEDFGS